MKGKKKISSKMQAIHTHINYERGKVGSSRRENSEPATYSPGFSEGQGVELVGTMRWPCPS